MNEYSYKKNIKVIEEMSRLLILLLKFIKGVK